MNRVLLSEYIKYPLKHPDGFVVVCVTFCLRKLYICHKKAGREGYGDYYG